MKPFSRGIWGCEVSTSSGRSVFSFEFEGMVFENARGCDLFVERSVIVEIKSVSKIITLHEQQLLTYLRLLDCRVGLISISALR